MRWAERDVQRDVSEKVTRASRGGRYRDGPSLLVPSHAGVAATRDALRPLLPPGSCDPLLVRLQQYVDAVVHEEWPAMASGGSANTAGRVLTKLGSAAFTAPRDTIDVRGRVDKLAELRALRLGQTSSGIVWSFVFPC